MGASSSEFQDYVSPGESIRKELPGTLIDDSYSSKGVIGVTDRRMLFVSNDGGFMDVAYDAISSIQSRPRVTLTYSGIRYRLLAVAGGMVAIAGAIATVVQQTGLLSVVLVLLTVCGAFAAEYVRRAGIGVEWTLPADESGPRALLPTGFDVIRPDGSSERADDHVLLILGVGLVPLAAVIGLVVVTGGLLVLPLTLVTLGGLAVTDYAYRRAKALEETGGGRRYERALSIHLTTGRIVRLRVDATATIDRELSEVARENGAHPNDDRVGGFPLDP